MPAIDASKPVKKVRRVQKFKGVRAVDGFAASTDGSSPVVYDQYLRALQRGRPRYRAGMSADLECRRKGRGDSTDLRAARHRGDRLLQSGVLQRPVRTLSPRRPGAGTTFAARSWNADRMSYCASIWWPHGSDRSCFPRLPRVVWLGDLHFQTYWLHALYTVKEDGMSRAAIYENLLRYFVSCRDWRRVYREVLKDDAHVIACNKSSSEDLARLGVRATYAPYPWPQLGAEPASQQPGGRHDPDLRVLRDASGARLALRAACHDR